MKVATMRRLDGTVGRVVCAVLTVVRRVTDPFRRSPSGPPQRILVIKLAEQGATVVAFDALHRAVGLVGPGNVALLVFEENRPIADELGIFGDDGIIAIDASTPTRLAPSLLAALREVRRRRFDVVVDFEGFSRLSAALAFASGARRRVGWHAYDGAGSARGDLFTHRVAANPLLHAGDAFVALVEAIEVDPALLPALPVGPSPRAEPPPVEPTDDELVAVRRLIDRAVPGHRGPVALLNPNGGDLLPLRRWPEASYVALGRQLLADRSDLAILVTGAPSEAETARRVARSIGSERCSSVAGETTLRSLLVLYSIADVLVTNDSGPAHYATLTPIDVVTLFGPESPDVFGARGERSVLLSARLPCSPCVNAFNDRRSSCRDNRCMQAITVEDVRAEVLGRLDARSGRP